jgi:hypothetical protein
MIKGAPRPGEHTPKKRRAQDASYFNLEQLPSVVYNYMLVCRPFDTKPSLEGSE